jgi:hypothetical protein
MQANCFLKSSYAEHKCKNLRNCFNTFVQNEKKRKYIIGSPVKKWSMYEWIRKQIQIVIFAHDKWKPYCFNIGKKNQQTNTWKNVNTAA